MKRAPRQFPLLVAVGAILLVLVLYPLMTLVVRTFVSEEGRMTLTNYVQTFSEPRTWRDLRHSLFVSVSSTLVSTALAGLLAWLVVRTNMPGADRIRSAFMFKFFVPPFVSALAWVQLAGPTGYANRLYMALTGAGEPLFVVYGRVGIVVVMSFSFAFTFLLLCNAMEKMDAVLEEAAQISGASRWRVLRDITLPIMTPAVLSAMLLTFIRRIANFGIPAIMGFGARYYVLTTRIYRLLGQSFVRPNAISLAVTMSLLLVVIALAAVALVYLYLRGREYTVISGKSSQVGKVDLGRWRYPALIFCLLVILLTVVLPLAAILLSALTRAYGLMPTLENLSLRNFRYVLFDLDMSRRGIVNSVVLAVTSASVVTAIGFVIAYLRTREKARGAGLLDALATIPQSIPGTVFALAIIVAWARSFLGLFNIYNTLSIIFLAYVGRYMAVAVRTITPALQQLSPSLEEAGRISGASSRRVVMDLVIPIIRPAVVGSWFLVLMPTLRELTISVLLWSAGNETIGVAVYNLQEGGNDLAASALGVIMIAVLYGVNLALKRITRGAYGY